MQPGTTGELPAEGEPAGGEPPLVSACGGLGQIPCNAFNDGVNGWTIVAGLINPLAIAAEVNAIGQALRAIFNGAEANVVYRSLNAAGEVQYVGITNNLARRAAEHLTGSGMQIAPLMEGLSRSDARAVEQALIEIHGLGKEGGTLLNRINSITRTNPAYAAQVQRGYNLLKSIGY